MIQVPEAIKELYHLDTCKKNIRIHFPNGERSDICNDLIVKDTVSFTESLCSQNSLRFGLAESPVFECETVGVGNIKDAIIEVYCEIYCDSTIAGAEWKVDLEAYVYPISYGRFVVTEAKRQGDIVHRKITAYGGRFFLDYYNLFEERKANDIYWSNTYDPKDALFTIASAGVFSGDSILFNKTAQTQTSSNTESDVYVIQWSPADGPYAGMQLTLYWSSVFIRYYLYTSQNGKQGEIDNLFEIEYDSQTMQSLKQQAFDLAIEYGCPTSYANIYFDNFLDGWHVEVHGNSGTQYSPIILWGVGVEPGRVGYVDRYMFYGRYPSTGQMMDVRIPTKVGALVIKDSNNNIIYQESRSDIDISYAFNKLTFKSDYSYLSGPRLSFPAIPDSTAGTYYHSFASEVSNGDRLNAIMELCGLWGTIGRGGSFDVMDIKRKFGLLPSYNEKPSTTLYPEGVTGGKIYPKDYQSCWYDDAYTLPYGRILCNYKDGNGNDATYSYWLTGYSDLSAYDDYLTYDISDNYYIQTYQWTRTNIAKICSTIAANIANVSYMPVDFVGRGLPYVEAGDTFEILTKSNESITTIVLNRTITGEQTLTDSYKSVGE